MHMVGTPDGSMWAKQEVRNYWKLLSHTGFSNILLLHCNYN